MKKTTLEEAKKFVEEMEVQDPNKQWQFKFETVSDKEYHKYLSYRGLLRKNGLYA